MSDLEHFERIHGLPIQCEKPESSVLARYRSRVPEKLISVWVRHGWCGYNNGLIWVVNPDSMMDLLEDWIEDVVNPPVPIARTAFADLFLWGQDGAHFLNVHFGRITRVSNSLEQFFNEFLCDEKNINGILRFKLFEEVFSRLGTLAATECYAFVPALALGGSASPETVQKVSMREHLGLLAEIVLD
jgi:hypothetical protein